MYLDSSEPLCVDNQQKLITHHVLFIKAFKRYLQFERRKLKENTHLPVSVLFFFIIEM